MADDSDDESRLRQAETRTIRKRKAAIPKEPPKRMATDKPFRGFRQTPERQNVMSGTHFTPRFYNQRQTTISAAARKKSSAQDICYYCGATGHWSYICPEKINKRAVSSTK